MKDLAGSIRNPDCTACPLHRSVKTVCIGAERVGKGDPEILVIGEAPGRQEDATGRPFVGDSGRLIREELAKAGFHNYVITNVIKCRPPDNRDPKPEELKACRKYLDQEIRSLGLKYVLTLGRFSSKSVLKKSKITLDHGNLVETSNFVGMPAFHPAYCLRDPSKLPALQHDLRRLRKAIDGELEEDKEPTWKLVTAKTFQTFLDEFIEAPEFSYDTETSGLFPFDGKGQIRCLSVGLEDTSWVLPLDMPGSPLQGRKADIEELLGMLVEVAEKTDKLAIAQNGKFDQEWMMECYGVQFQLHFDTMLASHILDENQDHDLKYMARTELDAPEYDIPKKEKQGANLHIPAQRQKYWRYAGFDAAYTYRLKQIFAPRLAENPQLKRLFYKLVMPAARAIRRIEARGITLDMDKYAEVEKQITAERDEVKRELDALVRKHNQGKLINWNSHPQVRHFLYEILGLETTVKTDGGLPSTGEDAIVELRGQHPVADQLVKYREKEKFLGTYIEGWKEYIHDSKLYLGYKVHGTVTGRYSSRLHQVPRDGTIRNLATAPPGWDFFQADLSQAELRIAAELSRDLELVSCFRPGGQDVHWRTLLYMIGSGRSKEYTKQAIATAAEIERVRDKDLILTEAVEILSKAGHNRSIELWKPWKEGRKKAKAINFGFVFGMYEKKFIQQAKTKYDWDCTYDEAHDFRTAYFELYNGVPPWHEKQKKLCRLDGFVRNLFGRIRRLPGIYSRDKDLRMEAERQAINSPVQGTIGDWKAAALIEIEETIPTSKLRLVGEHHDALLGIVRPEYRDEVLPMVRRIMRRPSLFDLFKITTVVPMESEIEVGPWGAGKTYEDPENARKTNSIVRL